MEKTETDDARQRADEAIDGAAAGNHGQGLTGDYRHTSQRRASVRLYNTLEVHLSEAHRCLTGHSHAGGCKLSVNCNDGIAVSSKHATQASH